MGSSPMIDHFADEPHSWGSTPGSGSYGRNNADVWEPSTPNSAFSPPVIALVAVIASAFLIVGYYRYFLKYCKPCLSRIRTRNEVEGAVVQDSDGYQPFTQNFGLDEAVMKKIPVCRYRKGDKFIEGTECAVCLLEFQENESLRVLPKCSHAFHVKCIDMWLKSNANCPLCRANVVCPGDSFINPPVVNPPILDHNSTVLHEILGTDTNGNRQEQSRDAQIRMLDGERDVKSFNMETETCINVQNNEKSEAKIIEIGESGARHLCRSFSLGSFQYVLPEISIELLESNIDANILPLRDTPSPWRHTRKTFRWNKRVLPYSSNRTEICPYLISKEHNSVSILMLSPALIHSRDAGETSGRSSMDTNYRVVGQHPWRSLKSESPLFINTSSRLRSGDPEALLSPHRFYQRMKL